MFFEITWKSLSVIVTEAVRLFRYTYPICVEFPVIVDIVVHAKSIVAAFQLYVIYRLLSGNDDFHIVECALRRSC